MRKIRFRQMDRIQVIPDDDFMFQWCCKCGARHIWHFKIRLAQNKKEEDVIIISGRRDWMAERLRKFYDRQIKKKR